MVKVKWAEREGRKGENFYRIGDGYVGIGRERNAARS